MVILFIMYFKIQNAQLGISYSPLLFVEQFSLHWKPEYRSGICTMPYELGKGLLNLCI